ncbi:MAG: hypothetical protein GY765_36205 [bacterium]|nr:hypothetical protein [bacterium]
MKKFMTRKLFSVSLILAFVCLAFLPLSANDLYKDSKSVIKGNVTINGQEITIDAVTEEKYDKESGRFLLFGLERKPRLNRFIIEHGWYHVTGLIGEIIFLKRIGDRGVARTDFGKFGTLIDEFVLTSVEPIVIEHRFSGSLEGVPEVKSHADKLCMEFSWFRSGKAYGTATYQAETLEGETLAVPVTYQIDTDIAHLNGLEAFINETGTNLLGLYRGWARITDFNHETGEYRGESQYEAYPTGITPVADGHGIITKKEGRYHTLGYGIDDHHIIPGRLESVEVSALQWVDWKTTKVANFLTVIGPESKPHIPAAQAGIMELGENPMVYTAIRGFLPGDIEKTGEQTLNLGGEIYTTSAKLMTKKELQSNFPNYDFSRLTPANGEELYCTALWNNVTYANGKRIHSGYWSVRPADDPFVVSKDEEDTPKMPVELHPMIRYFSKLNHMILWYMSHLQTMSKPTDYEYHDVFVKADLVATHHYFEIKLFGGERGNSIVNITGIAGNDPRDPYKMIGFKPGDIKYLRDSVVVDILGNVITSHTELMTREQVENRFDGIDASHLPREGFVSVDLFENVVMTTNLKQ